MDGLVVGPGQGRQLVARAQGVTFKVTGEHASFASCFEVEVPPGFDVGAHTHERAEEFFYLIDGRLDVLAFEPTERSTDSWLSWESSDGQRVTRVEPGTCIFVPRGCPHAFTNPTDTPARMLFMCAPPPDHERYFEELWEIFSAEASIDPAAVGKLRKRYDVNQITPLRFATS
jgi:oxalate decarboxylase/phosphoglucose isomerase-like protein (cupin superfamily)